MWQIVAIMVMGFGTDPHVYPLNSERDAIVNTHYGSKPLNFITKESCHNYMLQNVEAIKKFASLQFDGKPVKQIICAENPE